MSTWRRYRDGTENGPRRLRPSLDGLARVLGGVGAGPLEVVFSHWEEVVGKVLASHAEPLNLRAGVLVVAVREPAWATQLRFFEAQILDRLAEAAGSPVADRIEVRVRPGGGRR